MGSQQVLLFGVGIVLVVTAVFVGIDYFVSQSIESNRDAVIIDLNAIANQAQQYYSKPVETGGGGRNFTGFQVASGYASNLNGTYTIVSTTVNRIVFEGVGTEYSDTQVGCSSSSEKATYQISVSPMESTIRKVY